MTFGSLTTHRRAVLPIVGLLTVGSMGLAACGGSDSGSGSSGSGGGAGKGIGVALILKDSTNPYFIAMQKGAKADAAKADVKLTVGAGKQDGDTQGQITLVENAIAAGDKGILITPNGPGVFSAITKARKAGLYVIALDTPPDPASLVDITFATDNFEAGKLIGQYAAQKLAGKDAVIAMLDLSNTQVVSVDVNRDHGFLTGMGIEPGSTTVNGKEASTGKYTGGKGGSYTVACHQPTNGAQPDGRTAMENCLTKNPNINVVYAINEPAGMGGYDALKAAGKTNQAFVVGIDGGCAGVAAVGSGELAATSQQYPLKMASLGVDAIAKIANGGAKPTTSSGLSFFNTGVNLIADKAMTGVKSMTVAEGKAQCWG